MYYYSIIYIKIINYGTTFIYYFIERFSIFTELGVDKKKRFRTVWQKDTSESVPRIITVHREDE